MTAFSIVIPCYKNPVYLSLCLDSIINGQTRDNQIIVVLDGFLEMFTGFAEKYPEVSFLPLAQNMGMSYAYNVGVFNASNERIIIVNDDQVFPVNWDCDNGLGYYLTHQRDKVITIDQIEREQSMLFNFHVGNYGTPDKFDQKAFDADCSRFYDETETPNGRIFPFIINKVDFLKVGGLNNGWFSSPQIVDLDLFLKLELCKMEFIRTHRCHLFHWGSTATVKGNESQMFREKEAKAAQAYQYMWSIPPYYGKDHSKLPPENIVNGIRFR